MRTEAVAYVLARMEGDSALLAYFASHYPGAKPNFFGGLKFNAEAAECPYIAVAAMQEKKDATPSIDRTMQVVIGYGVNEKDVDTEELPDRRRLVYRGVTRISEIGELILDALREQPIGELPDTVYWTGEATSRSDAGMQHPLYEGEIVITLSLRIP